MIMTSYDLLAWQQRQNEDDPHVGRPLFHDECGLADVAVAQVLSWLIGALAKLGRKLIDISEKS